MKGKEKKIETKGKEQGGRKIPFLLRFPAVRPGPRHGDPREHPAGSPGFLQRGAGQEGFFSPPRDSFALPQLGKSLHVPKCPELKLRLLPVRSWAGGRGGPSPAALGA